MEKLHPDFVLCMTDEVLIRPKVQEFLRVFQLNESTTQNAFIRAVMRLLPKEHLKKKIQQVLTDLLLRQQSPKAEAPFYTSTHM